MHNKYFLGTAAMLVLLVEAACTYDYAREGMHTWLGRTYATEGSELHRNSRDHFAASTKFYVPFSTTMLGPKADVPQMEYLCDAIKYRFADSWCAVRPENQNEILQSAQGAGAQYIIYSEIHNWDDQQHNANVEPGESHPVTQWTGIDRVSVILTIHDVATGHLLDQLEIRAQTGVFQGYHQSPAELLRQAYRDATEALIAQTPL